MSNSPEEITRLRLDKWLWAARFFKTRSLAAKTVGGGVRINGARTEKPHANVRPGDTLTFRQEKVTRVVRVVALGEGRVSQRLQVEALCIRERLLRVQVALQREVVLGVAGGPVVAHGVRVARHQVARVYHVEVGLLERLLVGIQAHEPS